MRLSNAVPHGSRKLYVGTAYLGRDLFQHDPKPNAPFGNTNTLAPKREYKGTDPSRLYEITYKLIGEVWIRGGFARGLSIVSRFMAWQAAFHFTCINGKHDITLQVHFAVLIRILTPGGSSQALPRQWYAVPHAFTVSLGTSNTSALTAHGGDRRLPNVPCY
ncbi:hypothetical protein CTheo_904 [Ceratobasidium theobromae]|uniref:Uncharacterized protein n=1 Tax=Ceratobasidium theobromae TaxID=1582974 RepID=A0A5N5QWX0_9AGAM|nr:hypothetical protein CTheo_904 [Ceratobasidium theobromae]